MPVDPTGTTPGLTPATEIPETINMKCRISSCDSISAVIIKIPNLPPQQRLYRCVKCQHTWGLNVGGSVNL